MDGEPGTLADRYQLGELLGEGGMAVVRRARDLVLDRPVAVKVLRETVDDHDRDRFVGEARLVARLSHPGVVTILDAGIDAAQPFLVMELVEGPTLADRLRGGPLEPAEVARIGAEVSAALAYAHGLGVIHRDVKPANVILGPGGRVKLADFGIARLIGDTVRHTRTGTFVGTAAYLSPEQVRGLPVGPPSDVYSLGLVLLESVTGRRAYSGSPVEVAMARLHRAPDVPDDLPDALGTLLRAMTASDPEQRPPTSLVGERLRAFGGRSAPPAGPPAPPPAPPHPARSDAAGAGTTLVMAAPPPEVSPAATPAPAQPVAVEAARRAVGQLGDATRAWRSRAGRWWRGVPIDRRAAGAALGLLILLLVVLAVVGANSGEEQDRVPRQTPSELRDPLQDLHDVIHGGGP